MEFNIEKFGKQVRLYRKQRHLTQKELSELIGCNQSAISDVESGKREPSIGLFKDICNALGINMNEFIDGYIPLTKSQIDESKRRKEILLEFYENLDDLKLDSMELVNLFVKLSLDDKRMVLEYVRRLS